MTSRTRHAPGGHLLHVEFLTTTAERRCTQSAFAEGKSSVKAQTTLICISHNGSLKTADIDDLQEAKALLTGHVFALVTQT